MQVILGKKQLQTQKFLTDGRRIPVTEVLTPDNPVISIKTQDKDGYWAVQLGFGNKKHPSKALQGHIKGTRIEQDPLFLREVRLTNPKADEMPKAGEHIKVMDVLKEGDIGEVMGTSKGKGFAGGVKRFHFKGGPRTHGQSDRERAPGSIGQTTTPGRVYKGKRMAGKMGNERVSVANLKIVAVSSDRVWIKGLVPRVRGGLVTITKTGEDKKFVSLVANTLKVEEPIAQETESKQVETVSQAA